MDGAVPAWVVTEAQLASAEAVVREHAVRTPLIPLPDGPDGVFLKLESAQHTGSFKLRGALAAVAALSAADRARGVVTASAGNHGYGLAFAGQRLGVDVTVYCGRSAPEVKRDGIRSAGAKLEVLALDRIDDVEAHAQEIARARGVPYVSPYDDPNVAAGNGGTLALEILDALPDVGTIVTPVGGGGLLAGLAEARRLRGASFELVGVQSEACPSMAESLRLDRAMLTYDEQPSVAEGLAGGVSEATFRIARAAVREMALVSEAAIVEAVRFMRDRAGILIEGSAAPPLAWIRRDPPCKKPCVLVVSGGNVDPARFA